MAAPFKRLGACALNCPSRIPQRARIPKLRSWQRPLSSSAHWRADDAKKPPQDGDDWISSQLSVENTEGAEQSSESKKPKKPEVKEEAKPEAKKAEAAPVDTPQKPSDSSAKKPSTASKPASTSQKKTEDKKANPTPNAQSEPPAKPPADGIESEPAANSFLMKMLGVKPLESKREVQPQLVNERGWPVDEEGWPKHPETAVSPAEAFKYGEFGDDFDHLKPPIPDAESQAFTGAVQSLKQAMESGAPDAEITTLLRNVSEAQKALSAANTAWEEQFNAAVGEDVEKHWQNAISERQEEWDEYQEELKAMEKDMLAREPETSGYWNMGEENEGLGDDEEFRNDDLTSLGHAELEQHREIREYARLAAWEMPLLSKLAKPFEVPTAATPLRFRYTTYMGEEHPAARKVVVDFSPSEIPNLTPLQKDKLVKLAGVRYNPSTDRIKMSCENFEHPTQNKRYLSDLVDKLIAEAKDGKDTFKDVPFDFRHHKPKPKYEFPEHWKITPERQAQLEAKRQTIANTEARRIDGGKVVDGLRIVEEAFKAIPPREHIPELVAVAAEKGGKPVRRLV